MYKITLTGRIGGARKNAVSNERDAVNIRLARNYSKATRDQAGNRTGYEDATDWLGVAFFGDKGKYDKMLDTTFRNGNVVEIEARLVERSKQEGDKNITETIVQGLSINVLHWAPADGAAAGQQGNQGGQGNQQASGDAGNGGAPAGAAGPVDDFDDDIPF